MVKPMKRPLILAAMLAVIGWVTGGVAAFGQAEKDAKPAVAGDYIVSGHVRDSEGHGLVGATVEWGSDKTSFTRRQRVATDKDGAYRLVIKKLNGENHFAAAAPGYSAEYESSTFVRGSQVRDFVLR